MPLFDQISQINGGIFCCVTNIQIYVVVKKNNSVDTTRVSERKPWYFSEVSSDKLIIFFTGCFSCADPDPPHKKDPKYFQPEDESCFFEDMSTKDITNWS
jgi:hypothetical protein